MLFEITGCGCEDLEDRHVLLVVKQPGGGVGGASGEANRSADVRLFEALRNIAGLQAVDHLFDIPFDEAIQAIDG